jgi:serine/threonine protein kinase/tetratricopeptide (TPR) repeat protein
MNVQLPPVGDLVAGRYRILKEIGRGGFGVVYKARQEVMGRLVALKCLTPEACKDEVEVERFRREVFHASGLTHPNTITLYDYGQTPHGLFYIVMEYLEGHNLREWTGIHGALSYDEAYTVLKQLLSSLEEAHQLGIIHRDLKLENIFLRRLPGGELAVKVLDFGLSKYIGEDPSRVNLGGQPLTADGLICGTPQYMAPERAYGEDAGPAADIYAVGIMAHELLTGKEAYTGSTAMEILLKQINQSIPKLPGPLANSDLAEFIEICTQKKAEDRFSDASAALAWLHSPMRDGQRPPVAAAPLAANADFPTVVDDPSRQTTRREFEMRLAQLSLVGRDQELRSMLDWTQQALKQGGLLHLTSEAGMGKSRLVEEWLSHIVELGSLCLLKGCFRQEGLAIETLRDAFAPLLAERSPYSHWSPGSGSGESVHLVDDARQILGLTARSVSSVHDAGGQAWAVARLTQLLAGRALGQPTLLVLEDIHHADAFCRSLLEHIQQEVDQRSLSLAVVVTSRHRELDEDPRAQVLSWKLEHIALGPLSNEATHSLAHRLIPAGPVFEDQLQVASQGNPFVLIEMARHLVDRGYVVYDDDRESWLFERDATSLDALPPDVESLLLQRLEHLLVHHRRGPLLQAFLMRGAILGAAFSRSMLEDLLVGEDRPDLLDQQRDTLEELCHLGILRPDEREHGAGFEFTHYLMRTALLARSREDVRTWRHLHEIVARLKVQSLDEASPEKAGARAAEIAFHYLQVRELPESFRWWLLAADYSERVHDFRGALAHLREVERLLDETLDPSGEQLLNLRLRQGRLYRYLGEFGPAEGALREALAETRRAGDLVGEALTGEALANVLKLMSRFEEALSLYDEVGRLYAGFRDSAGKLRCMLGRGDIARFKGRYREAEQEFSQVLTGARSRDDIALEIQAMLGLGRCAYASGHLLPARQLFEAAAEKAHQQGLAQLHCSALIEIGCVAMITTGLEEAEALTRFALDRARHLGDRLAEAHAHLILALILRRTTRLDLARRHARQARLLNEKLGHPYGIAKCLLLDAELAWVQSRLPDALDLVLDARRLHEQLSDVHGLALCMVFQGLFECEVGRSHDAHDTLHAAVELNGREGLGLYHPHCMLFLGMVYESESNLEEAIAYYGEALEAAERCSNREMASFASIALAKLHLVLGDVESARAEIPLAWEQARRLGHCYAMMFALTGQAWLSRLTHDPDTLRSALQHLRVYRDAPHGPDMRIGERLFQSAMLLLNQRERPHKEASVRALAELLYSLGDDALGEALRARYARPA